MLEFLVNNIDRTDKLRYQTLELRHELGGRAEATSILFSTSGEWRPDEGQPVEVRYNNALVFAGLIVDQTEESIYTGDSLIINYSLAISDWGIIPARTLIARAWDNTLAGDIVRNIIDVHLVEDGITYTADSIEDSFEVTRFVANYTSVAEALDQISDLTGFSWWITPDKVLHFHPAIDNSTGLETITETSHQRSITVQRNADDYRNIQIIRAGSDLTEPRTETFKGDGENKTFVLAFPVGRVPTSITVNSVEQGIGIRGIEDDKDFYWSGESNEISQDDAATPLTTSQTLAVTYQGRYPLILQRRDQTEINNRMSKESNAGRWWNVTDESNIDTIAMAAEKADGLLIRHGKPSVRAAVVLDSAHYSRDQLLGLRSGQYIEFDHPSHQLNGQFLVQSLSVSVHDDNRMIATLECVNTSWQGDWTDWFRRLYDRARQNLGQDGEILNLGELSSETIELSDTMSVDSGAYAEAVIGTAIIGESEII